MNCLVSEYKPGRKAPNKRSKGPISTMLYLPEIETCKIRTQEVVTLLDKTQTNINLGKYAYQPEFV